MTFPDGHAGVNHALGTSGFLYGRVLHRIPAQRAFWFGWYAAFPHTRLVQ